MKKTEVSSIFNAVTAMMLIFGWAFIATLGDFINRQNIESLTGLIGTTIVLTICFRVMFALANYKPKKKGGKKGRR
jgi:uncharacterized membrane protein YozB (DUF420 family)